MAELLNLLSLVQDSPTQFTVALSSLVVVGTFWLNSKKTNLEMLTSINKSQNDNLEALTVQNEKLTEKLFEMQRQLVQQLETVDKLSAELRQTRTELQDTRQHILQLEGLVKKYQAGCQGCTLNTKGIL